MSRFTRWHPVLLVLLVTLLLRGSVMAAGIQYDDGGVRGAIWLMAYALSLPFNMVDGALLLLGGGEELRAHGVLVGAITMGLYLSADLLLSRSGRMAAR